MSAGSIAQLVVFVIVLLALVKPLGVYGGLDPHITPAAALYQASRVACVRKVEESKVRALLERHIEGRQWGVFGEARVSALARRRNRATRATASGPFRA